MSAADAAAEILRREQENPGSVPPALLAKATALAGQGQGVERLPEQEIRPRPENAILYGQDYAPGFPKPEGKVEQFARRGMESAFVGANEFANAGALGIPQATGMIPGQQDPSYAALRKEHPMAALGGQVGGLMAPGNPANLAARGVMGAVGAAAPGLAGSVMGRAAMGAGEGAVAGGVGAGAITAAGGGTGDQIFNAASTGAGVGGALGAAGRLMVEPGRWLKGLLSSRGQPPQTGQMLPPAGPGGPPQGKPQPFPAIPDLEVPPAPEPMPAAAPHAPAEPPPDLSTIHRPGPGDTGMGVEEARRALDSEALHMANRTAATKKLLDIIPPGADSQWLAKMSADERAALADFVGVQQAGDDTWKAVGDALDVRAMGPTTRPSPPLPRESELARQAREASMARGRTYLDRAPLDSTSPTARLPPTNTPMPPIPGSPRMPNLSPEMVQMGARMLRGRGLGHGPLGIDPMLGMLLQSPQFVAATGMAAGTKLPAAQNRQPGQPIDLLNLYGM